MTQRLRSMIRIFGFFIVNHGSNILFWKQSLIFLFFLTNLKRSWWKKLEFFYEILDKRFVILKESKEKKKKKRKRKMHRCMVYHGEMVVGEVEIYQEENKNMDLKEIRISHFTQPSERCSPLAVLHTITSCGICFKMESTTSQTRQQQNSLFHLHSSCIRENKV